MKQWYVVSGLILLALLGSLAAAGPMVIRVDQPMPGVLAQGGGEPPDQPNQAVPGGGGANRTGEPLARRGCGNEMYCEEIHGLRTAPEMSGSTRPGPARVSEWLMSPAGFP